VVNFRPCSLYSQGKTPRTHWTRGWVNPRAGLGDLEKRKTSEPSRDLNSDRPASKLVTIPTAPWRIGFHVTQIEEKINRKLVYFEPLTAETRLRSQASPCGTCDGQSDIEILVSPNYSTSPCIIPSMPHTTDATPSYQLTLWSNKTPLSCTLKHASKFTVGGLH
jgi:hypothetical protein